MAISIIIPLFNKAPYIGETLAGFLGQLAEEDEILVVDDGSTDRGPELVAGPGHPQVRLLRTPSNQGPGSARNLGAQAAAGTHLLFFDADDLPHPDLLAEVRAAILRNPEALLFTFRIAYQAHAEQVDAAHAAAPAATRILPRHAFAESCLAGKPLCTASSTCVRADAFRMAGGFQPELRYCEDPELWARLSAAHPMVLIDRHLAVYRDVPVSLSHRARGVPGSVAPYVRTLLDLAEAEGPVYRRLAVAMITRNTLFTVALGGDRRAMRRYLSSVAPALSGGRYFLLWLLSFSPRMGLRWLFAWRSALLRFRPVLNRKR